MTRYAIIEGGQVANIAAADAAFAALRGWIPAGQAAIGDLWDGEHFTTPPVAVMPLADRQAAAISKIDADVDALYGVVIGNRQAEYEVAERQAQAYADSGYAGATPPMVDSWAVAKSWTGQQAADDILTIAAQWRGAQETIRAQRLLRKEQVRGALGAAAVDGLLAAWAGFIAQVRAQMGVA